MADLCFYFQVHQPNRLEEYDFFRIGEHAFYENDFLNADVLSRVSEKCYLPANSMFKEVIEGTGGAFKMCLSLTGVFIEQLEHHRPDVLESFKDLVATGCVEILGETYYHSLASVHSLPEFRRQIEAHRSKIKEVFGVTPSVFRNTELIYSNAIAAEVEGLGFDGIIAEGLSPNSTEINPNRLHRAPNVESVTTLLRNARLSDDLGFRFADSSWAHYPLTAERFSSWINGESGDYVGLFLDYETIGEHQWADSGIFDLYRSIGEMAGKELNFITPSELCKKEKEREVYDCHEFTSWADHERDLSAWMGNVMQKEAIRKIHQLEKSVFEIADPDLTHVWSKLQTSDHFHYMATKGGTDGDVHQYFSPYKSPYDAYIYFMNALADLEIRLKRLNASS